MTDSIREQIFTAFGLRLTEITKLNQYNTDIGNEVLRSHLPPVTFEIVPCVGFHVDEEDSLELYAANQKKEVQIRVQAIAEAGSVQPPIMAERLYADIEECLLCNEYTLGYDSGGTNEIVVGNTVTGETSNAEGLVIAVSLSSGTWAGGDAAGAFTLRRVSGIFQDNEEIAVGVDTGAATVDGAMTGTGPNDLAGASLADGLTMVSGTLLMPEEGGIVVGVQVNFKIRYQQIAGNPYSQTN